MILEMLFRPAPVDWLLVGRPLGVTVCVRARTQCAYYKKHLKGAVDRRCRTTSERTSDYSLDIIGGAAIVNRTSASSICSYMRSGPIAIDAHVDEW